MKSKIALLLLSSIFFSILVYAQDKRLKLTDYLNQEILIEDSFSGQSITLIKESKDYLVLRKFFGSGISVISTTKYKVAFNSEYQLTFSDPIEVGNAIKGNKENFLLSVEENILRLYLNQLKVVIKERE